MYCIDTQIYKINKICFLFGLLGLLLENLIG